MIYWIILIILIVLALILYFVLPFFIYWYSSIQANAWKDVFIKFFPKHNEEVK